MKEFGHAFEMKYIYMFRSTAGQTTVEVGGSIVFSVFVLCFSSADPIAANK